RRKSLCCSCLTTWRAASSRTGTERWSDRSGWAMSSYHLPDASSLCPESASASRHSTTSIQPAWRRSSRTELLLQRSLALVDGFGRRQPHPDHTRQAPQSSASSSARGPRCPYRRLVVTTIHNAPSRRDACEPSVD